MNTIETTSTTNTPTSTEQTYRQLGANSAIHNMGAPNAIEQGLYTAYNRFIQYLQGNNQQLLRTEQAKKIALDNELTNAKAELSPLASNIAQVQQQIVDKQSDLTKVENDGVQADYLPFVITSILVVLLMMYLFIFYASTFYSAFFRLPSDAFASFIAPSAFSEAEGGALAFMILCPVIFIGMGYLIHYFYEQKRYALLGFILFFTLMFDVFLAYKIAKNTHDQLYATGAENTIWTVDMAYTNIDFYTIIAAGFVVYIIWGFLLNISLTEWKKMQPGQAQHAAIQAYRQDLVALNKQLNDYSNRLDQLKTTVIKDIEDKISQCNKNIAFLQAGGVVVSVTALRGISGEFMTGWNGLINLLKQVENPDEARQDITEANDIANNWLAKQSRALTNNTGSNVRFDPN